MLKVNNKERTSKGAGMAGGGRRNSNVQRYPIKLEADISTEIIQVRRKWNGIFKLLKKETVIQEYTI